LNRSALAFVVVASS